MTRLEPLQVCLGRRLGDARGQAALTQRQVAKALGISVSHVTQIERGLRTPRVDLLARWARLCSVTLSELFESVEVETDLLRLPKGL